MLTPVGKECRYFYGDYFRGRKREECRLLLDSAPQETWTPDLCRTCPVPAIQQANACEHLVLKGTIDRRLLGLMRRMAVAADCRKCDCTVADPQIGCGQCHPALTFLEGNP